MLKYFYHYLIHGFRWWHCKGCGDVVRTNCKRNLHCGGCGWKMTRGKSPKTWRSSQFPRS